MHVHAIDSLGSINPVDGFHGRVVHGEDCTLVFWTIEAGAELPTHDHPHEQVATILEGEFELTVDGQTRTLGVNDIVPIPGGVPHGGKAITATRMLDVFRPKRDDLKPS